MISYEKVRQSFKTWTTTLGVLYLMNAALFLFVTLGAVLNRVILEKQPELYASFNAQELALLKASSTPIVIFSFAVGLIATLIIGILALINRRKATKQLDQDINLMVYYLAIGWAIVSIALEYFSLGSIALLSPIYLLLFGFANLFTLRKAQILREKESEIS